MQPNVFQHGVAANEVKAVVESYSDLFDKKNVDQRDRKAVSLTRAYYDLATDFYEFGWGESFHFAPRFRGETLRESIVRHEHHLAVRLGLKPGMKVLDIGCGVGGPMREIARVSGANIVGLNNNSYQIGRAQKHNEKAGLAHLCSMQEGDFNKMPFEANTFDAIYTIEACCHAADWRGPYAEAFRVLKSGGVFAGYDWGMTARYVPGNPEHERVKLGVEKGNALSHLRPTSELPQALKDVGFTVLEAKDLLETGHPETPWYMTLKSGMTLNGFRNSKAGAFLTHQAVRALETLRLSPKGTTEMHNILRLAQSSLVEAGELDIFTPMYFFVARKP